MRNKPNFQKSQIFITAISTMDYSEKMKLDTWSKQTQTKPILFGLKRYWFSLRTMVWVGPRSL
jgi:hypothetical protein